jgi:dGTPase
VILTSLLPLTKLDCMQSGVQSKDGLNVMDWQKLMSFDRLRGEADAYDKARPPGLRDIDRIVFSSAFRRLQDKTQVFPLPLSDFVRTRLTHSIESSCVGRSLGAIVGDKVIKKYELDAKCGLTPIDFGVAVAAACLAHDIGNPPFGHSGEEAMRYWFLTSDLAKNLLEQMDERQGADFRKFEGNAQGFRILTRIQNSQREGGLQLTYSTLGTFTKYPRESDLPADDSFRGVSGKKHGFFQREAEYFQEVAESVGLIRRDGSIRRWARHPLAFLVEAADDICYHVIDFEDGYKLSHVSFDEITNRFSAILGSGEDLNEFDRIREESEKVAFLRAKAINVLVRQVAAAFVEKEDDILAGNFDDPLLSIIEAKQTMEEIFKRSKESVYSASSVVDIEAAGFDVIGGLLETFASATTDCAARGRGGSSRSKKYLQLLPQKFSREEADPYKRLLRITDYISGMTDSFAVALYKKIKGISLPSM